MSGTVNIKLGASVYRREMPSVYDLSMDADKRAVGKRIREAREAAGFKYKGDLAAAIGKNDHTVYRWESGRNLPDPDSLHKIASACHVTISYLLTGHDDRGMPPGLRDFLSTDMGRSMPREALDWLASIPEPDPNNPADVEWWRLMLRAWQLRLDMQNALRAANLSRHPERYDEQR